MCQTKGTKTSKGGETRLFSKGEVPKSGAIIRLHNLNGKDAKNKQIKED